MASMVDGPIDITQPGKYPIVLSDALLGKTTKEVYTSIRYNHKPDSSSSSQIASLRPSGSDPSIYDLSLRDESDKYSYTGARTTGDGQYVLIFDPVKKHFVLHRIDSTFDMNLVSAPWTQDSSALQTEFPQLEIETESKPKPQPPALQKRASKAKKAAVAKAEAPPKKVTKARKPKVPVREPSPEDDDSDGGFTIEYPGSAPPIQQNHVPSFQRQISEDASDEDEDAEHESYEEEEEHEHNQDVDHLKLPSPANNAGGLSDEDMQTDLEKELEAEFEEVLKESNGADAGESSESEEE